MKPYISRAADIIRRNERSLIWIILGAALAERLYILFFLGPQFNLESDDLSYIKAGIRFLETGEITMHGDLSAQIMPGMPVMIGALAAVFGKGTALWTAVKLLWMFFGCGTAFLAYRGANMFVPERYAALPCLLFLTPDLAGLDSVPLSDTPYMFLLTLSLYLALYAGKTHRPGAVWLYLGTGVLSMLFRANALPFLIISAVYLVLRRYPLRKLLVQCGAAALCVVLLLIPWVMRNHDVFGEYIITYGGNNPLYVGTMQGYGYPSEASVDYSEEQSVIDGLKDEYMAAHPELDELPDYMERYYFHRLNGLQAKKRASIWFKTEPLSMALSYLVIKPAQYILLYKNYAADAFLLRRLRQQLPYVLLKAVCFASMIAALVTSIKRRKYRSELGLLVGTYLANVAVFSIGYVAARYEMSLTAFKVMALAFYLLMVKRRIGAGELSVKEQEADKE